MNNQKNSTGRLWPVVIFCILSLLLVSCKTASPAGDSAVNSTGAPAGDSSAAQEASAETSTEASAEESAAQSADTSAAAESQNGGSESADAQAGESGEAQGTESQSSNASSEAAEAESQPEPEVYGYGLFGGNPYEGGGLAAITPEQEAAIRQMISEMTLEEKVGQMFFARFPGGTADPYSPAQAQAVVDQFHVGGFVLFKEDFNVDSDTAIIDKLDAVQASSVIPLLMAVDEEGGYVNRVSPYFRDSEFLSPKNAYAWGGEGVLMSEIYERCELLGDLHLNMNLYPVCDLSDNPEDFIYNRAFSGDPDTAADYIAEVVKLMQGYHMACSLKHFPGYGNNVDTHTGIAVDERDRETFYAQDFRPFAAGIAQGAQTVMVSHNIVKAFDAEFPASLSPEMHRVLREDLGFEGVIVTDDLGMGAVAEYTDGRVAVQAVIAGNDMLITKEYETQYQEVMDAVNGGVITEERIEESVYRILRMKVSMGLLKL